MQVYDSVLPDHDVASRLFSRRYKGSATLRVRKRNQDRRRQGLYPRLMKGTRPQYCVVQRHGIKEWITRLYLAVSSDCTKRRRDVLIRHCFPAFGRTTGTGSRCRDSRSRKVLGCVYTGEAHFSGITMRWGGSRKPFTLGCQNRFCFCRAGTARALQPDRTWYQRTHECFTRQRELCDLIRSADSVSLPVGAMAGVYTSWESPRKPRSLYSGAVTDDRTRGATASKRRPTPLWRRRVDSGANHGGLTAFDERGRLG